MEYEGTDIANKSARPRKAEARVKGGKACRNRSLEDAMEESGEQGAQVQALPC